MLPVLLLGLRSIHAGEPIEKLYKAYNYAFE